ncbi:MAG: amino acid ABC transporter substrate-binding protein [Betaproteobacteria bacterium]|nr:amino acid ABC transporter substrate-binding protein [Betaproteobacteria bacterium]
MIPLCRFFLLYGCACLLSAAAHAGILETLHQSGLLKVCIWPDYYGISYRNPHTGQLSGIDIDLSQDLAKDLGVKLQYVETDFSRLLGDIESGRCQIAMMGVGITPGRQQHVAFSQPYLRSDIYAVASLENQAVQKWADIDQSGRIVVVQKGTFMDPLMERTLKHATLIKVVRTAEREREVETGRADVFITDYPYSRQILDSADWARVISPDATVSMTDYGYAVARGDPEWLARINHFVQEVRQDGRLRAAATRYHLLPMLLKTRAVP